MFYNSGHLFLFPSKLCNYSKDNNANSYITQSVKSPKISNYFRDNVILIWHSPCLCVNIYTLFPLKEITINLVIVCNFRHHNVPVDLKKEKRSTNLGPADSVTLVWLLITVTTPFRDQHKKWTFRAQRPWKQNPLISYLVPKDTRHLLVICARGVLDDLNDRSLLLYNGLLIPCNSSTKKDITRLWRDFNI